MAKKYMISDTKFINNFKKTVFPKVEGVPYEEGSIVRKLKLFEEYVEYMTGHGAIEPGREMTLECKYMANHIQKEIAASDKVKLPISF